MLPATPCPFAFSHRSIDRGTRLSQTATKHQLLINGNSVPSNTRRHISRISTVARVIAIWSLFGVMACANASPDAARLMLSCASGDAPVVHTLPVDALKITLHGRGGWLEVQERGQVLEFAGSAPGQIDIPQPLRYGWHWRRLHAGDEVTVRRADSGAAHGMIELALHCSVSDGLRARLAWLKRAGLLAPVINRSAERRQLPRLKRRTQRLIDTAPDSLTRALALHLYAQLLIVNGLDVESATAFATARRAWQALGMPDQALAARVGQVGSLYLSGNYTSVLNRTASPSRLRGIVSYFQVRLQNTRCLSLQAMGKLNAAQACYRWVLHHYRALREASEFVVSLQNYASLLRDEGHLARAEQVGQRALRSVSGTDAPMTRGRIHVMLADLYLRHGQINRSLQQSDQALDAFSDAQQNVKRWQADVYLHLAKLYTQLGAYNEACDALAAGVERLDVGNAPSRYAVAMETFADIESAQRHLRSALLWERAAEIMYRQLHMPAALDAARAERVRLQTELGEWDAAQGVIDEHHDKFRANAVAWQLLRVGLALQHRDANAAATQLKALRAARLSLPEQIELAGIDARYRELTGDSQAAQRGLMHAAKRLRQIALSATNPVLRFVLERQTLPLRRLAFELALKQARADHNERSAIQAIWPWFELSATLPAARRAQARTSSTAQGFNRAVGEQLYTMSSTRRHAANSKAQRELLSLFAQPSPMHQQRAPSMPLAKLQAHLASHQAAIAYVRGETLGAVLWVTRDRVELRPAPSPSRMGAEVDVLNAQLRSPSSPASEIYTAADRLSRQLLPRLDSARRPDYLSVVDDGLLDRVAWSVMRWPGSDKRMVDTTPVAVTELEAMPARKRRQGSDALHIIVESQPGGTGNLPALIDAGAEPKLIAASVDDRRITVQYGHDLHMAGLTRTFAEAGAWVHISAHGTTRPGHFGYSGIWLNPAAPHTHPRFLSWLDLLNTHVNSAVVVLNACQLAERGNVVSNNLSFASAVSLAGAGQVVASLWSISDAATALWDPAFYKALDSDSRHDVARALRVAQQRLHHSREFSHPFFWSGMQAIVHLDLSSIGPGNAHSGQSAAGWKQP